MPPAFLAMSFSASLPAAPASFSLLPYNVLQVKLPAWLMAGLTGGTWEVLLLLVIPCPHQDNMINMVKN